jgi:quinol monooxygenase YgiN
MVLQVTKWNVHPDKADAYNEWVGSAVRRTLAVPGLVEFRAYRPHTGEYQIVATYEFEDLAAWAAWRSNEDMQRLENELRTLVSDVTNEVWGPSPVVPKPIRPGG